MSVVEDRLAVLADLRYRWRAFVIGALIQEHGYEYAVAKKRHWIERVDADWHIYLRR